MCQDLASIAKTVRTKMQAGCGVEVCTFFLFCYFIHGKSTSGKVFFFCFGMNLDQQIDILLT